MRIRTVGLLRQETREDHERQILQLSLLHIERDRSRHGHSKIQERAKTRRHGGKTALGIDRIQLRIEGGQFDGQIDARDGASVVPFRDSSGRPGYCGFLQLTQSLQAAVSVPVRLIFSDRGFTQ